MKTGRDFPWKGMSGMNCLNRLTLNACRVAVKGWRMEGQNQFESLLCQGNGYLGVRAAAELPSPLRMRGLFIAGSYDALPGEVCELPVAADAFGLELWVDGRYITMEDARNYECRLELDTGLLVRRYQIGSRSGARVSVELSRLVSLANPHLLAQRITLHADRACHIALTQALDGSVTNGGAQHMRLTGRRCRPGDCWRLGLQTLQSGVGMAFCTAGEAEGVSPQTGIAMARRTIGTRYEWRAEPGIKATFTWYTGIHTTRDKSAREPEEAALQTALDARKAGFAAMARQSAEAWAEYWEKHDVALDGPVFDQTAIRFALYHLRIMTPVDDGRMNIGAKGLSGEAYRGHTFWDTEMFMLMPWALTQPEAARNLLTYRFYCLPAARKKAAAHGCAGALFPWESAWPEDGEQTPAEGEPDVATGKPIPIRTGEMEIHVNADVAMGVWRYFEATGDEAFMRELGWEILWETGLYWADRAEWNDALERYELNGVIGPDEYTEPANNNAYTNILAHWNIEKALEAAKHGCYASPEQLAKLQKVADALYLPKPDAAGVLPQCDGFAQWPMLDISEFKGKPGAILKRYNVEQLSGIQAAKQADVMALMTLLPEYLSPGQWAANLDYYEPRCLHDSSLSYNTFSLAAARLGRAKQAYELFLKAASVDLNDGLSSAAGIHAAAMGGIWQCAVMGFGGVEVRGEELHLNPCLPARWKKLSFPLRFRGVELFVTLNREQALIRCKTPVSLWFRGTRVTAVGEMSFPYQTLEENNEVV